MTLKLRPFEEKLVELAAKEAEGKPGADIERSKAITETLCGLVEFPDEVEVWVMETPHAKLYLKDGKPVPEPKGKAKADEMHALMAGRRKLDAKFGILGFDVSLMARDIEAELASDLVLMKEQCPKTFRTLFFCPYALALVDGASCYTRYAKYAYVEVSRG